MNAHDAEEVTIGKLIVAFTEVALSSARDEKEAGKVAANIISDLLHNAEPISKCWH